MGGGGSLKRGEKACTRRKAGKLLVLIAAAFLLIAGGAIILFRDELKIVASIKKIADNKRIYYMEVVGEYHFEDFLASGGASSDKAVSAFLTKHISKGFYSAGVTESGPACSTISAYTSDGSHVWGRNFDWKGSVPIVVRCIIVDTSVVTNFNLANGNTAAGGENAKQRFEYLSSLHKENEGFLTGEQVKHALIQVAQQNERWTTQWSIVYEQDALSVSFYFDCDFNKAYSLQITKR